MLKLLPKPYKIELIYRGSDDGFKSAGNYEFRLDTTGLSEGNYYYQLRTNTNSQTKVLLIQR